MVFLGGVVVCSCSFFGGVEGAEVYSFIVMPDGGAPLSLVFGEPDAFVAGAWISFSGILSILGDGCEAEICFPVIEAVSVDMVDDETFGDLSLR